MPEWTIAEPRKLTFDGRTDKLQVRIVGGTVNVVGTDEGSARLEVSEIEGPPLIVTQEGSTLTVAYEDLPWKGLLGWLDRKGWKRHAVVSLAVPADSRVEVGVIAANAVVSGIGGRTSVNGVSGDATLVGLSGPVDVNTVSGSIEAQSLSGDIKANSVSGELTVVDGSGGRVKADSVSGGMVLDLGPRSGTDVRLSTVSGEVAIRLPDPGDAEVDANTASGSVFSSFDELHVTSQWGAKRLTGTLGKGDGKLRVTTVSGTIALLRRPPAEPDDEPHDEPGGPEGKVL
jgi:Putative adhesin